MAYGPGFAGNLPAFKPMLTQTPPPVANPTTAPGPITDYSAGQLRMLNHSEPAPMPAGGAARPPISRQAPINSSVGQMTPRSGGLGGAVSPNASSLSKFDNFLRPNTAFTPQATVNTPGIIEGMANTPRSMGPLFSGSVPPSAYSTYLSNGGVLPPEAPKPVADLSAMRGNPGSTVGYSMGGGGQPPRSPGAPFAVPPSAGGGGVQPADPGALAGAAGALNGVGRFVTGGSIGGTLARSPILYAAGSAAKQAYDAGMDVYNDRPNATLQASIPYRRATYDNINSGNYGAAAVNAARAMGTTGYEVGKNMLAPFSNFLGQAYNELKGSASAAPVTPPPPSAPPPPAPPPSAPPPSSPPPAVPPAAQPSGPRTVQPGPQGQSLSERYPERFKGVPKFGDVVNGGAANGRVPLTAQEKNYNAQILRGLELENRARELENVDRYRATQLHDNRALATLQASRAGGLAHQFAREQLDPEGRTDAVQQKLSQLDDRSDAVTRALFNPSDTSPEGKINSARQLQQRLNNAREALGLPTLSLEEMLQSNYGLQRDPKTGYFYKPK